jgi:ABC-type transport system involved in multi-copper enzyme maturation permease subunit
MSVAGAMRAGFCESRVKVFSAVNIQTEKLRRAVVVVAMLNLAYFFVEFAAARHIGSVSLFADSIDFLEDASVNFLVLVALGWSAQRRAAVGMLLALLLLVVTTNLSSMAIVREKELGTLEQLNVTPLARSELIIGKLVPYAVLGMVDVLLVVAVAVGWFEVPLRGSFWLLIGMCLVYLLSTLGLGLFVSTISKTQQQAMMTAIFFFLTPMIYLSGFIFPIENMPQWIQPLTYLIPLRYFLIIVRGIFLKGIGLEILWPHALALTAWGLGVLTLATLRSSKRLA